MMGWDDFNNTVKISKSNRHSPTSFPSLKKRQHQELYESFNVSLLRIDLKMFAEVTRDRIQAGISPYIILQTL